MAMRYDVFMADPVGTFRYGSAEPAPVPAVGYEEADPLAMILPGPPPVYEEADPLTIDMPVSKDGGGLFFLARATGGAAEHDLIRR